MFRVCVYYFLCFCLHLAKMYRTGCRLKTSRVTQQNRHSVRNAKSRDGGCVQNVRCIGLQTYPILWAKDMNCFLGVIPTLTHYSDIVSDIPSASIYGIYVFSDILPDILAHTLTFYLEFFLAFYLVSILTYFLAYIITFFLVFYRAFSLASSLACVRVQAWPHPELAILGFSPSHDMAGMARSRKSGVYRWSYPWSQDRRSHSSNHAKSAENQPLALDTQYFEAGCEILLPQNG